MNARPEAHRRRHPLVLAVGCLFVAVAVGSTLFVFAVLGGERRHLDSLSPLTEEAMSNLQPDQQVLLTATVSRRNPPLVHDLVVACKEEWVDGTWHTRRRRVQPLIVDHGDTEVLVTLRHPCPRGTGYRTIDDPNVQRYRWVGITGGTPVTVVGTVTSVNSPAVFVEHYFVGDHRRVPRLPVQHSVVRAALRVHHAPDRLHAPSREVSLGDASGARTTPVALQPGPIRRFGPRPFHARLRCVPRERDDPTPAVSLLSPDAVQGGSSRWHKQCMGWRS